MEGLKTKENVIKIITNKQKLVSKVLFLIIINFIQSTSVIKNLYII